MQVKAENGVVVITGGRGGSTVIKCPSCQCESIKMNDYGKKTGGTIGIVAGVAAGTGGAFTGAETGAMLGLVAGPAGLAIGAFAGAIVGAIFGGAAGCAAGATIGKIADDTILDNYTCLNCGLIFGADQIQHS
jgi:hypothetical protein